MIATMLATLFVAAAVLALGAIADSWRTYGEAALALRAQVRACGAASREVRCTLITTEVRLRERQPVSYRVTPPAGRLPFQPALRAA